MPQPTKYNRNHNFHQYQENNPDAPYVGQHHDDEFNDARLSINEIIDNLGLIQRDDGKLRNLSVHQDALSDSVRALLSLAGTNIRGAWQAATEYKKGDVVSVSKESFIAHTDHTSGVSFESTNWLLLSAGMSNTRIINNAASITRADLGNLLIFTGGTYTVSLDAAADLGSDFTFDYICRATQVTLDGSIDMVLKSGDQGTFWSTGTTINTRLLKRGLSKGDRDSVLFSKTGNFTAETAQDFHYGSIFVSEGTSLVMPASPTAGTDYFTWLRPDGTIEATDSMSTPPVAGAVLIGGFHYAPGGNAPLNVSGDWTLHDGGNTTAQINEHSFWDLKWRPSAPDPRGLTLVNNAFWCGIYLLSQDHLAGPVHRNDVNIAKDGAAPQNPYGDGSQYYSDANFWNISEALQYHGFRCPNSAEYQLLAIGTKEQASRGNDPVTTGIGTTNSGSSNTDEKFTSHWGVIQSAGCIQIWSSDVLLEDGSSALGYGSQGRGGRTAYRRVAFLGRSWGAGSESGSRASTTGAVATSLTSFGGRGVCDHLIFA